MPQIFINSLYLHKSFYFKVLYLKRRKVFFKIGKHRIVEFLITQFKILEQDLIIKQKTEFFYVEFITMRIAENLYKHFLLRPNFIL
jgi:hypothetical protein